MKEGRVKRCMISEGVREWLCSESEWRDDRVVSYG